MIKDLSVTNSATTGSDSSVDVAAIDRGRVGASSARAAIGESAEERSRARPLKIILISPTFSGPLGGADRDWVGLANALGPERIRLSWAGTNGCDKLRRYLDSRLVGKLVDIDLSRFTYLTQENAYQSRTPWLWTKILIDHAIRAWPSLMSLRQALMDEPIDLVVSNTSQVTIGPAFAALRRVPHVWCVKEYLDINRPASRRMAWWISHLSSAVIVPSTPLAKPFPKRVHIFHDGSDVDEITTGARTRSRSEVLLDLALPVDRPVVAQVGGFQWWKGQHVTADAFVRLSRTGRRPDFSLLFLGEEVGHQRMQLEEILSQAPSEWREAVRFACFESGDFSFLAAADVVVHPSVLPDPLPNAVREAMILGKPVVASRDGGIPEMIRHGETGLLIEPDNVDQLARVLTDLIGSPETQQRLGEAARRFAVDHFDSRSRMLDFYDLFLEVANQRKKSSRALAQ